jgi:hypothetical protein
VITLANSQLLNSAQTNVAPVVLSGFYSISNCLYDKPNSTLVALSATGGSTNSIDYFQYINADNLYVNGSGNFSQNLLVGENFTAYGNAGISGLLTASGLNVTTSANANILTAASGSSSPQQRRGEVFTVYGNAGVSGNLVASGITVASGNTSPIQRAGEVFTVFGSAGISGMLNASGITVYGTMGVSGLLTASGLTVFGGAGVSGLLTASGLNIGAPANTGVIAGLSTTSTVPALSFQSVTANHTNTSHVIFDFRKNISTRVLYIDGVGNTTIDSSNGNLVVPSTGPSTGNGALIAHGMRRSTTTAGMDFAWGESISSASEPGIDLFPIGGTHMVSGILFRLSKNSTKSDVAMIINGSGNVGIGTSDPNAPLHVVGNTNISGVLTATSGSITTLNTVPTFTSPSALGSSQGDWNPGAGDVIRASASVSGVAISGIFLGNEYTRVLINVGTTNNLTLKHQASTATSGYRIITPNGGDYIVQPTGAATILYDIVDNRWRVL